MMTYTLPKRQSIFLPMTLAFVLFLALSLGVGRADALIVNTLDVGSSGSDVRELQTFLAADVSLYPEGIVSGYFGALTEAAVRRFQARYGIDSIGRVGPQTRAKLNELIGGGGGDVWAPTMSAETVMVTGRNVTVNWTTNEPARSRVMYATSFPFLYAGAQSSADVSLDTGTSIPLLSLSPSTTYFYVRESVDAFGNIMWTTNRTFTTGQ